MGGILGIGIGIIVLFVVTAPFFMLLPHFRINEKWAFAALLAFPIGAVALLWWMALKLKDMEDPR